VEKVSAERAVQEPEPPPLRERLEAMRDSLIDGLGAQPHLDAGFLQLLATVGAALAALDQK
jgi:hypothetical protein